MKALALERELMTLSQLNIHIKGDGPVVMIDDDTSTLRLMEVYYKKSELKVPLLTFFSGAAFFAYLEKVKVREAKIPLIAFIDINMPGMDGFEVLENLKNDAMFRDIPVCAMLTSSDHEQDKRKAFELGAEEYIVKPNSGAVYLELFNLIAALHEQA